MTFSTTLPAPGTLINGAGQADANGLPAPGFSGVGLRSSYEADRLRTRSNRGLVVAKDSHYWSFTISYHEMTVEAFNAIESFILGHNTRLNPFYVTLPNYAAPAEPFATYANANTITLQAAAFAGDTTVLINGTDDLVPGCYINLVDDADALHESTYKVARVETNTTYTGSQPPVGTQRITLFPPVQRDTVGTVEAVFINPKFRVIQTSPQNVEYDENNIVSFSMAVEEILP